MLGTAGSLILFAVIIALVALMLITMAAASMGRITDRVATTVLIGTAIGALVAVFTGALVA